MRLPSEDKVARAPAVLTRRAQDMSELPQIIKMNIAHYEALLKLDTTTEQRARIEVLRTEAKTALLATRRGE
jgi:hypothetical protein